VKIEKVKHIQDFSQERIPEAIKILCYKARMEVFNNRYSIKVSLKTHQPIEQVKHSRTRTERAIVHSSSNSK